MKTRGLRNYNPGNIRLGSAWKGMRREQTDPAFVQFVAPVWGLRALVRVLRNYQRKHGLNTIRQIINRWAPPSENDTEAYVDSVAQYVGIDPDQAIDVVQIMPRLVAAIVKHENGIQPYSAALIGQAILLERTA